MLDRGDDEAFFEAVPTVSIDESVLERSGRVAAARADFHWMTLGAGRPSRGHSRRILPGIVDVASSMPWTPRTLLFGRRMARSFYLE